MPRGWLPRTDPGQGAASISGNQASVRLRKNPIPWGGEEHGSTDNAVHLVDPVDGLKIRDSYK